MKTPLFNADQKIELRILFPTYFNLPLHLDADDVHHDEGKALFVPTHLEKGPGGPLILDEDGLHPLWQLMHLYVQVVRRKINLEENVGLGVWVLLAEHTF